MSTTQPDSLYHYSNAEELVKILNEGALPFTRPTDDHKLEQTFNEIVKILQKLIPGFPNNLVAFSRSNAYPVYTFPLYPNPDMKGQNGNFSFKVDTASIVTLHARNLEIHPCLYDEAAKEKFVMDSIVQTWMTPTYFTNPNADHSMLVKAFTAIETNIQNYIGLFKEINQKDDNETLLINANRYLVYDGGGKQLVPLPIAYPWDGGKGILSVSIVGEDNKLLISDFKVLSGH